MSERTLPGSCLTQSEVDELRRNISFIVEAWPDLLSQLGRTLTIASDGMPGATSRTPGLVLNETISDLMAEVASWGYFLARILIDETDWTPPPRHDPPILLAAIAKWRLGHFTHHDDAFLAMSVCEDAHDLRGKVARAAYPDGYRTLDTGLPCEEHDVDDAGRRVACAGHYTVRPTPTGAMPDLVCSHNRDHRVSPAAWSHSGWRRTHNPAMDATAMLTLARTIVATDVCRSNPRTGGSHGSALLRAM